MGTSAAQEWLLRAPEWISSVPEWVSNLCYRFFKSFIYNESYLLVIKGLGNTLVLTFFALLIGIVLGVVVSLVRVTWDKNRLNMHGAGKVGMWLANAVCRLYLTVIRGTPVVVQIMIMFFVIFATSRNKVFVGCLAFGINSGAYVAEIIRGGIMSVDAGQNEAGRSLGFGYVSTMRYIILPQAFKTVLPSLANEFIVLLKETAVVGYIGLADLTYASNTIGGSTYDYMFPLISAAVVYLVLVVFFTALVGRLEKSLQKSEGRGNKRLRSVHRGVTRSMEEVDT